MKTTLTIAILCYLQMLSLSYGEERKEDIKKASIKHLIGGWKSAKFEGKDADPYSEVIKHVEMKIQKDGNVEITVTYKKDALIQFKGNPKMTPDGKVLSKGKIWIKGKELKISMSDAEDDISTVSFRNGNLLTKSDDEDVTILFKRIPEKNK